MRRHCTTALALLATACATANPPPVPAPARAQAAGARTIALANAGFESAARPGERCPQGWGCSMHSAADAYVIRVDASMPAEGRQSLCIERVKDEPWALVTQLVSDSSVRGATLRVSMAVRIERAEGAGAGPWILAKAPNGVLVHREQPVAAAGAWRRVFVDAPIPASAQTVEAGVTMLGGGRACVDDVRLEVISP